MEKKWTDKALDATVEALSKDDILCAETLIREVIKSDENNGEAWQMLAYLLVEKTNRFEEAIVAGKRAVELMPEDGYSWWSLGLAYSRNDQSALAIKPLEKAAELLPKEVNPLTELMLAKIMLGEEKKEIESLFARALAINPNSAEVWTSIALYYLPYSPEIGLYNVEQALKFDPNFKAALHTKAECLYKLNRLEEAEIILKKLLENCQGKFIWDDAAVFRLLGEIYIKQREHEWAIAAFEKAIALAPDDHQSYQKLAYLYFFTGKLKEAEQCIKKLAELKPDADLSEITKLAARVEEISQTLRLPQGQSEGWKSIDQIIAEKWSIDILLGYYNLALAVKPGDARLYHSLGSIWTVSERPDKALPYFQKACELAPEKYPLALSYGTCLVMLKEYKLAREILEKRFQQEGLTEYEESHCRIQLADCFLHLANPQRALELTEKIINYSGERDTLFTLWQIRGEAFYALREYEQAKKSFQKLLGIANNNKDFSYIWNYLGMTLFHLGERREARGAFLKAIELKPNQWHAYYNLGQAYLQDKEFDQARGPFQVATSLEPQCGPAHEGILDTMSPLRRDVLSPILATRMLAAVYARAVREKDRRLQEILDLQIAAICRQPELGHIGHMYYTGHWQAIIEVLIQYRKYIKGPLLDIGCGVGSQAFSLSLLAELGVMEIDRIAGVDIDTAALAFAEQTIPLLQGLKKTEFTFTYGDITAHNWRAPQPEKFQTIVSCFIWHWIGSNLPQVMKNIVNSLLPNSYLIVINEFPDRVTPSPFAKYAGITMGTEKDKSPSEIKDAAAKAGLVLIAAKEGIPVIPPETEYRHDTTFILIFQKVE